MLEKVISVISGFMKDERGTDLPVTAILAGILGVGALGAAIYLIGKVKGNMNSTGNTMDTAAQQQY